MLIWGTKPVTKSIGTGSFYCPQCGSEQHYKQKQVQKHGHLYFIPLVGMGDPIEYVECSGCRETFKSEVLNYNPRASEEAFRSEYDTALRRLMVLTMMADGVIEDSEIETIQEIYQGVTGREYARDHVMAEIEAAEAEGHGPAMFAQAIGPYLNANGKELIIKAIVSVGAADGNLDDSEFTLLLEVAGALDISKAHFEGILAEMSSSN